MLVRRLALAVLLGVSACGEGAAGNSSAAGSSSTAAAAAGVAARRDSTSTDIAARIEQAVWNQSPPAWTTEARWSLMRRVYDGGRYAPLWVSSRGPTASGRALIDALCAALDEGIHPAAFAADSGAWDTTSAVALAATDLRLSAAALDYLTALAAGQTAPGGLTAAWRGPAPATPADSLLAHALPLAIGSSARLLRPARDGYASLSAAFQRYRRTAIDGDWTLPDTVGTLRPGVQDPAVLQLRRRLIRSGDLTAADSAGATYDAPVLAAVRRVQRRLGLTADGVVGPATWSALAVPAVARATAVAANLERYRWLPRQPAGTALVLDAGSGSVELRAGAEVFYRGRAELTEECAAGLPPAFADSVTAVRQAPRGVTLELAGGRSLAWQAGRTGRAGGGCVRVDDLNALAGAMRGVRAPVLLYVVTPTARADSAGHVHFRHDTTGDDARLEAALTPILSRPAPPVCAVSRGRRPAPVLPGPDSARAPRRP